MHKRPDFSGQKQYCAAKTEKEDGKPILMQNGKEKLFSRLWERLRARFTKIGQAKE